ncbi:MAG: hypothetical protein R3F34_00170 [Planctomycetota bacterium]
MSRSASRARVPAPLLGACALVAAGAFADRVEGALVWSLLVATGTGWFAAPRAWWLAPLAFGLATTATTSAAFGLAAPWSAALVAGVAAVLGAIGRRSPGTARAAAPLAVAAVLLVARLPDLVGAAPAGFARVDPTLAARLLDASPTTWVVESAGLDLMRHPAVYAPAGTDWFSDARTPVRGELAGTIALVLGCAASFLAARQRTESRR